MANNYYMIGFIDPYINSPAFHCFNGLVEEFSRKFFYHMPGKFGIESMQELAPKTMAYIIAGSASNITESLDWHKPLADFLVSELNAGKPVLAACFGHQLLCHAFGSEVDDMFPTKEKLLGVREVEITEDFYNFVKGEKFTLPVTHRQVVKTLGPELKAVGFGIKNDLVIHKSLPLLATQAHPEASRHFCAYDIQKLSEEQETLGRKDGKRLIQMFLDYYGI
jgi:GMP synthase-like glutamine amidotransferase